MDLKNEFPDSPFEQKHSLYQNKFKYRKEDIIKIIRYLPRLVNKKTPEHFFIIENRSKTSFAKYVSSFVEKNYQMLPIYVNNESANTINDLIQNLVEEIFNEFNKKTWGRKLISTLVEDVDEIYIDRYGFYLRNKPVLVDNIKNNFANFLIKISEGLKDKKGIFIVIDDINGLSDNLGFANWYKALFETLYFDEEDIPISFTLISCSNKFEELCNQNPSFTRMFNLIELDYLDD